MALTLVGLNLTNTKAFTFDKVPYVKRKVFLGSAVEATKDLGDNYQDVVLEKQYC